MGELKASSGARGSRTLKYAQASVLRRATSISRPKTNLPSG